MDALGLLGNLMGSNATGGGIGGQLLGGLLGSHQQASRSQMRSSSSRLGRNAMLGALGGLAVSALTKYFKSRQDNTAAQSDFSDLEAIATTNRFDENEANSRAEILIRAMINAAKADGHVDEREQQNIFQRLDNVGREEADFLRRELQSPLNMNEFIRSVPRGMGQEVYTISLMGIKLDEHSEAKYLAQLAEGLGLSADECNRIHREAGAPEIFE